MLFFRCIEHILSEVVDNKEWKKRTWTTTDFYNQHITVDQDYPNLTVTKLNQGVFNLNYAVY